jgi:hypothetical protein
MNPNRKIPAIPNSYFFAVEEYRGRPVAIEHCFDCLTIEQAVDLLREREDTIAVYRVDGAAITDVSKVVALAYVNSGHVQDTCEANGSDTDFDEQVPELVQRFALAECEAMLEGALEERKLHRAHVQFESMGRL